MHESRPPGDLRGAFLTAGGDSSPPSPATPASAAVVRRHEPERFKTLECGAIPPGRQLEVAASDTVEGAQVEYKEVSDELLELARGIRLLVPWYHKWSVSVTWGYRRIGGQIGKQIKKAD